MAGAKIACLFVTMSRRRVGDSKNSKAVMVTCEELLHHDKEESVERSPMIIELNHRSSSSSQV